MKEKEVRPYHSPTAMQLLQWSRKKAWRKGMRGHWGGEVFSCEDSGLGIHWKDWCWRWNSNILATWCEELTHLKDPGVGKDWRQEKKGMTEDEDGWMASPTQWTWVWVNSGSWWWTGRPGVLRLMGLQRVGHDWATELNWTKTRKTQISIDGWMDKENVVCVYIYIHTDI